MNRYTKYGYGNKFLALLAATMFMVATVAPASPASDDQSLLRGGVADATPQQKYQSAIREAGGAYKESLRECSQASIADRRACASLAKDSYDRDMAEAKLLVRGR
jgi:hypothetical protein